ncbi:hypothetical protein H2200_009960 [Cladophialophora chaetospira]|uniref:Xylanolytic transcriptional activator regulatory domain-containing protein n=1 Tax=Cladophialophora chaetospira TaxID=386627 RepID=A0AA39CEG6_9EURO|nr:hypothetical protein H2200_009960 [Cladophialophora chaetospira]
MREKGVFETLPNQVEDEIIRCYFEHVHFFMPVVDAASFLDGYATSRHELSPLLLWSMRLAAANFASSDLLSRAGYSSRRAMKTAMYERAKCLYDFDRGTDKLILIQSVILMGFWYTDPQDHTGAWYWIGIAISLCQNLGLHRDPRSNIRGPGPSESYVRHARRVWWTCFVRDRWVSLAKGRPMRIHHEDCDVPMPVASDILLDLEQVPSELRHKFLPLDYEALAPVWVRLVQVSGVLGDILRAHYRATGPRPSLETIDNLTEQLERCALRGQVPESSGDCLRIYAEQVELFYQATVTVLYRPYVLGGTAALPGTAPPSWHKTTLGKARAGASSTNNILEKLIELDAIRYLKPMIITAMVPAMQVHLFDYKSIEPLINGLAGNRLQLCMLVLAKLRETYWSAGVMYRLFERAQRIIQESKHSTLRAVPALSQTPADARTEPENEPVSMSQAQLQNHDKVPLLDTNSADWPLTSIPMNTGSLWDDPLGFDTVDELLGPGFGLPDDAFQGLFPSIGISAQLGPVLLSQNDVPQSAWLG